MSGAEDFSDRRVLLAVTGASGAIYAERILNILIRKVPRIYLCFTESGRQVIEHELRSVTNPGELSLRQLAAGEVPETARSVIRMFKNDNLFAPVASGSSAPTDMIILPCSMGTMGRIAGGISSNLIERAADVVLKQRNKLVVCPRETPLNLIHLRNMTALAEAGAIIVPPMPAFYQRPQTIDDMVDFVVGRVLEVIGIPHSLYQKWNIPMV